MTTDEAIAFIQRHGVVLVAGKGPVPRLVEAIAQEPIKGSWWGHPKSHQIFAVLEEVAASKDILVCRLIDKKVTLVHRRLWPALVRTAHRFSKSQVSQVVQEHTSAGHHINREIAFPKWVPAEIKREAESMTEEEALSSLGPWATSAKSL
jgi:hypothetical protein